MAKNDNLKDYLTDLYEGIKAKKPNASRNPQNFRQEIESIETGVDTTDATATANDILKGKTAYGADGKIEGTIPTYDYSVDEGGNSDSLTKIVTYHRGLIEATTLPNDGTLVDKIHIYWDFDETLEKYITNANLTFFNFNEWSIYPFLFNSNTYDAYIIYNYAPNCYSILRINFLDQTDVTLYYSTESGVVLDNIEIDNLYNSWIQLPNSVETISSFQGIPVGTENYKLDKLFSSTPFYGYVPEVVEELSGLYENTSLDISETNIPNNKIIQLLPYLKERKIITSIRVSLEHLIKNLNNDTFTYHTYTDESLTYIRRNLFYGTKSIPSFSFPNVEIINEAAFANTNAFNFNLPKVKQIRSNAFKGAALLTEIKLPVCSYIDEGSFYNCSNLTDVYLGYDGIVTINILLNKPAFDCHTYIHVRPEYADQYATATNWSSMIESGRITIIGDYTDE